MPDHMSYYYRSRRGWRRIRGFRVNSGRLSVHRLRFRFFHLINLIRRWKRACDQALIAFSKGISRSRCSSSISRRDCINGISSSRRGLVIQKHCISGSECKLRSYARSNSFYAEAIADCLEFIKRSALTMEDEGTGNSCRSSDVDGSWVQ